MQVQIQRQKAITLIALVITVIVLLILAGVAISTLGGNDGLIAKVEKAKTEQMKAEAKENINMAIIEIQTEETPKGNKVTLQTLNDKLNEVDNRIQPKDYAAGDTELKGTYTTDKDTKFNFKIDEKLNVIIGELAEEEKIFPITVTDIEKTSIRVTGNVEELNTIGATEFTYVAETSASNQIKFENITETSYVLTGLEPETEYDVYMLAYDNAGNVTKSNVETIKTKNLEIENTTPIITATSETTDTKDVEDHSQKVGTELYIKFDATLEGTPCTITPAVPFKITTFGTYTFTVTGTYGGITKTKEISVEVNKYQIYEIRTAQDFQNMKDDLAGTYYVMNDIDMTGFEFTPISGNFTGTLDGQGHTISNLTITNTLEYSSGSKSYYTGIFKKIDGATIKNILLKDVNVTSASAYIGVIAGDVYSSSRPCNFIKVGITGNISGTSYIGSFLGSGYATFENCYARTNLTLTRSNYDVGGFAGSGSRAITVLNSYWSGTTNATGRVGTFKANYSNNNQNTTNSPPTLTNCYYNSDLFTLSVPESISGTPLTTDKFANSSNFTGWDFTNDWYIGADGYPELKFK